MPSKAKIDNHDPTAKLALRRDFLRRYHTAGADVVDCCAGQGVIWKKLREEFKVSAYLALDLKAKKGRLRIDSSQYLRLPGWRHDVIDCDVYGSPWRHWFAMLPNIKRPTTVFLTIGNNRVGTAGSMAMLSNEECDVLGWHFKAKMPATLYSQIGKHLSIAYCLSAARRYGVEIVEAVEAIADGNARYVGVRVTPATTITAVRPAFSITSAEDF
jgi:hypothetical protein